MELTEFADLIHTRVGELKRSVWEPNTLVLGRTQHQNPILEQTLEEISHLGTVYEH